MRMIQIQDNISEQKNLKDKLESEQEKLHVEYNKVSIPIQTHRQAGHVCGNWPHEQRIITLMENKWCMVGYSHQGHQ